MKLPDDQRIPVCDTVYGVTDYCAATTLFPVQAGDINLPFGSDVVWLGPAACLIQSRLPSLEREVLVVDVVGVADYGKWVGAVLLLD